VTLKRKPAKRRPPGVGCRVVTKRRCSRDAITTVNGVRMCAKHAADALFAKATREACDGRCWAEGAAGVKCNGKIQCAHLISRRYLAIRWDEANAMPLCAAHHTYFTLHPLEWEEFCRSAGVDWDDLRRRALNDPPMDPETVVKRYQGVAV